MTANELMIGDWAIHYGHPTKITGLSPEIDTNGEIHYYFFNDVEWYSIDELEPIPLTEEILKKNGFEHETNVGFIHEDYNTSNQIIVDRWDNTIKILHNYDIVYCYTYYRTVNVHELQHLLRMLEIDKEIIV